MGGITGTGLISGIDTAALVDQLLAVAGRPRDLASRRLVQLQTQQAAFLDINSRVSALRTAAQAFRTDATFQAKSARSSNADVVTATASNRAQPGNYTFSVDRLVSTQQLLTRGFQDRDQSAFGATQFTFEPEQARLDRDTALAELNGGQGIRRGKIEITLDGASPGDPPIEVDLSRVATVNEVLDAINTALPSGASAKIEDGSFVIDGASSVTSVSGFSTAESLGLETDGPSANGTVDADGVTGASVFGLTRDTSLATLNDGNGVQLRLEDLPGLSDFNIRLRDDDGSNARVVGVNLSGVFEFDDDDEVQELESPVSTVGGVIDRINRALSDAGETGVTARIDEATGSIAFDLADNTDISFAEAGGTAARDLGLISAASTDAGAGTETVNGARVLAGLNTVLLRNLGGGAGGGPIPGDGQIDITLSSGATFGLNLNTRTLTLPPTGTFPASFQVNLADIGGAGPAEGFEDPITTMNDLLDAFENLPAAIQQAMDSVPPTDYPPIGDFAIDVALNDTGTGLLLRDLSGGSSGPLIVSGTTGNDTAAALGISTGAAGTTTGSVSGSSQLRYLSEATRLDSLRGGQGIGQGEIRIIGSTGQARTFDIDEDTQTLGDLISEINADGAFLGVRARINDNGDGLLIESTGGPGGQRIEISDETGSVATRLGIAGTAEDNVSNNSLDGSLERVVTFDPTDTLDEALEKINEAGAGVTATIINDGSPSSPFRISITSTSSGADGRFVLDTAGFDLGIQTLDEGNDARVFFGSTDPTKAVLVTSSTNSLGDLIDGVDLDLVSASEDPVTVTVSSDTSAVEDQVEAFVSAYNSLLDRIGQQTRFVEDTGERGALLGDSTLLGLQNALFNTANGRITGFDQTLDRLVDVGITLGEGGRLEFDTAEFRDALASDPEGVEALFTRRTLDPDSGKTIIPGQPLFNTDGSPKLDGEGNQLIGPPIEIDDPSAGDEFTQLGLIPRIEELARRYVDSIDGVLTRRNQALDTQIQSQRDRIESLNAGLSRERARLEAQFVAMEQALAGLQNQSAALAGLSGLSF